MPALKIAVPQGTVVRRKRGSVLLADLVNPGTPALLPHLPGPCLVRAVPFGVPDESSPWANLIGLSGSKDVSRAQ